MRIVSAIFILVFASFNTCFGDESNDEGVSWDKIYSDYGTLNPSMNKPVTDKEFDNALESVKNRTKKIKKEKPGKKNKENDNIFSTNEPLMIEQPVLRTMLLTLPCNIYYKKEVVPQGFYSVVPIHRDSRYFLDLTQGGRVIVEVEMDKLDEQVCPDELQCVRAEVVEDKYLKLQCKELDFSLERYFYIQNP